MVRHILKRFLIFHQVNEIIIWKSAIQTKFKMSRLQFLKRWYAVHLHEYIITFVDSVSANFTRNGFFNWKRVIYFHIQSMFC